MANGSDNNAKRSNGQVLRSVETLVARLDERLEGHIDSEGAMLERIEQNTIENSKAIVALQIDTGKQGTRIKVIAGSLVAIGGAVVTAIVGKLV